MPAVLFLIECLGGIRRWAPTISRLRPAYQSVLWHTQQTDSAALTIDDAPGSLPEMHSLLDVLRGTHVKATFFIIASFVTAERAPLLRRMVAEGHELGNHMVYDEKTTAYTPERFEHDLLECERVIAEASAPSSPKWFRPPSGRLAPWQVPILAKHGYRIALGDVYPLDVAFAPADRQAIVDHVVKMARPGSIIIVHAPDREHNGRGWLLSPIVEAIHRLGLALTTLSAATA